MVAEEDFQCKEGGFGDGGIPVEDMLPMSRFPRVPGTIGQRIFFFQGRDDGECVEVLRGTRGRLTLQERDKLMRPGALDVDEGNKDVGGSVLVERAPGK